MKTFRRNQFITNEAAGVEVGPTIVENAADFVRGNRTFVKRFLAANGDFSKLRTNDQLRKDEWKQLDQALVEMATIRLRPLEILRGRGLVQPLDGLGVLLSQYEKLSDMTDAEVNMSAAVKTQEDTVDFSLVSVPVPVISKDFRIDARKLAASRRTGEGIDVTQVRTATRKVSEKIVDLVFNGTNYKLDGSSMPGIVSFADRNVLATVGDWGTVANIYTDILNAIDALQQDYMFGPYGIFIANTQYLQTQAYISASDQTALMRIKAIPNVAFVEPCDQLTAGQAVVMQLTSDVFDIAIGQDIQLVEWEDMGGLMLHFKVMAALAPRPKSDYDSKCGILQLVGI